MMVHGRALTEVGLLVYLLTIPMGRGLETWSRELPLVAVMAGMVLARIPWPRTAESSAPFRLLIPLVLFAVSTLLSTLFSEFPDKSLARAAYSPIAFLLFLATQEVAITPTAYRRILLVFAAVVIVLGLDGTYQFRTGVSLLGGSLPFSGRITGSLPHPNDLALIPILLPSALTLVILDPLAWASRLILCGLPFAFATVILSQSRNAWLGLAVGLGTLAALGSRRRLILFTAMLAVTLFGVAYALGIGNVPNRTQKILETFHEPRIGHWLVAWQMFKESPLLGKGVHTFGEFYLPYLEKIVLPASIRPEVAYIPWAHNLYLEVLAERGMVGSIAFGATLVAMALVLFECLKWRTPSETRTISIGLTASLVTFLVQGVFDLTFLKDWVILVFWLLAALVARLPTRSLASSLHLRLRRS